MRGLFLGEANPLTWFDPSLEVGNWFDGKYETAPAGGGTTHVVTASVMAFAGQAVTSSAARLIIVAPASMAMAGQSVGSVNAVVHVVTAAMVNHAGQLASSIAATVHAVAAGLKAMAGQLVQSATPTSHAVDPAAENYAGNDIDGGGVAGVGGPVRSGHYGRYYCYKTS